MSRGQQNFGCSQHLLEASVLPDLRPAAANSPRSPTRKMQAGLHTGIGRLINLGIVTRYSVNSEHSCSLSRKNCLTLRSPNVQITSEFSTIPTFEPEKSPSMADTMGNSKLDQTVLALRAVVPALSLSRHKGQAGKIAVIGGCREYTGAPYFSAISALKVGADLSHVFCTLGAATVIKSYSPELIVHPILEESYNVKGEEYEVITKVLAEVDKWLERFDCLVIGPGLGRDPFLLKCVAEIIRRARHNQIPLVIDGDGLFIITNDPELVCGYPLAILTPNVNEHRRLVAKMKDKYGNGSTKWQEITDEDLPGQLKELAKQMGGLTIVQKGKTDYISDGNAVFASDFFGSPRRCGGQGDVLSGSIGVFMTWAQDFYNRSGSSDAKMLVAERISNNPAIVAAAAGSIILRRAAAEAFKKQKRSMVTTDIIDYLGNSMEEMFPV